MSQLMDRLDEFELLKSFPVRMKNNMQMVNSVQTMALV